jgi:hypothetical protein
VRLQLGRAFDKGVARAFGVVQVKWRSAMAFRPCLVCLLGGLLLASCGEANPSPLQPSLEPVTSDSGGLPDGASLKPGESVSRTIAPVDPWCSPEGPLSEYGGPCQTFRIETGESSQLTMSLSWGDSAARFVLYICQSAKCISQYGDQSPSILRSDVARGQSVVLIVQLQPPVPRGGESYTIEPTLGS